MKYQYWLQSNSEVVSPDGRMAVCQLHRGNNSETGIMYRPLDFEQTGFGLFVSSDRTDRVPTDLIVTERSSLDRLMTLMVLVTAYQLFSSTVVSAD